MKDEYDFGNAKRGAIMSKDSKLVIEPAVQDLVDCFEKEVMEILYALDFPESFVTDYSQIFDFIPMSFGVKKVELDKIKEKEAIDTLKNLFDNTIEITPRDNLGELARKLNYYRKSQTIN